MQKLCLNLYQGAYRSQRVKTHDDRSYLKKSEHFKDN